MFRRAIPITDGVFQVKAIGARVTVLTEGGKVLLVDAGLRGSGSTITRGLRAAGLSPDRIGLSSPTLIRTTRAALGN